MRPEMRLVFVSIQRRFPEPLEQPMMHSVTPNRSLFTDTGSLNAMTSSQESSDDCTVQAIELVEHNRSRYFVNTTSADIDRLRYVTVTLGNNYASSVPTFELTDIPSGCAVEIEEVDPYEDGMILWQIVQVDWSSGITYKGTEKRTDLPQRWSEGWAIIEREKKMIGEPSPPQVFDDDGDVLTP